MIYLILSVISAVAMVASAVKGHDQSALFYWLCTMVLIVACTASYNRKSDRNAARRRQVQEWQERNTIDRTTYAEQLTREQLFRDYDKIEL